MKQKPTKKCEHGVQLRPASIEEAGLFYSELDETQDEALGTVGHIRMDFGSGGKEFWHTWWPHNEDRFNTLEFKEELQAIVDTLRANGPLKDLASMSNYCHKNGGAITEDSRSFGYVAETGHYLYCLRCTPTPGDYQGYLLSHGSINLIRNFSESRCLLNYEHGSAQTQGIVQRAGVVLSRM